MEPLCILGGWGSTYALEIKQCRISLPNFTNNNVSAINILRETFADNYEGSCMAIMLLAEGNMYFIGMLVLVVVCVVALSIALGE